MRTLRSSSNIGAGICVRIIYCFLEVYAELVKVKAGKLNKFRLDSPLEVVVTRSLRFLSFLNLLHLELNELLIIGLNPLSLGDFDPAIVRDFGLIDHKSHTDPSQVDWVEFKAGKALSGRVFELLIIADTSMHVVFYFECVEHECIV